MWWFSISKHVSLTVLHCWQLLERSRAWAVVKTIVCVYIRITNQDLECWNFAKRTPLARMKVRPQFLINFLYQIFKPVSHFYGDMRCIYKTPFYRKKNPIIKIYRYMCVLSIIFYLINMLNSSFYCIKLRCALNF